MYNKFSILELLSNLKMLLLSITMFLVDLKPPCVVDIIVGKEVRNCNITSASDRLTIQDEVGFSE